MKKTSVALIGMPGAGKTTLGRLLAQNWRWVFTDTDALIETRQGCSLQDIVDRQGYLALRAIEEEVILSVDAPRQVIATGGSAAYSERAMRHLMAQALIVFLDIPAAELTRRITDFTARGIARRPEQTFAELFQERRILYQRYADITLRGGECPPAETLGMLLQQLNDTGGISGKE